MATAIDELPLNERQRANKAKQLPQTGLNPVDGIANLAADAGASVQRGVEQQGRALRTVGTGAFDALNRADPVRDAAMGIAGGIGVAYDATKQFFTDSANAARTSSYGLDPDPRMTGTPIQAIAQPAGGVAAPAAPVTAAAAQAPAALPVIPQPAAGGAGASASATMNQTTTKGVADGGISAGIPSAPAAVQRAIPATARRTIAETPARAAANQQIALANGLMQRPDGGIGEGIVAQGAIKRAGNLSAIDAQQMSGNATAAGVENAAKNTDIAAFNAQSQDMARQEEVRTHAAKRQSEEEDRRLRKELAGLTDKDDPDGSRRAALKARISTISGKGEDHFQPTLGKDEMGNTVVIGSFDKRTGKHYDTAGQPIKSQNDVGRAHADAQAAVARGMDKAEANRRLLAAGYPAIQ